MGTTGANVKWLRMRFLSLTKRATGGEGLSTSIALFVPDSLISVSNYLMGYSVVDTVKLLSESMGE